MPFDRVGNNLLTPVRPLEHRYVQDDPARAIGASGLDIAREGSQTLDRGNQLGYNTRRYGLTPPVRTSPDNEYGDILYAPTTIYPA